MSAALQPVPERTPAIAILRPAAVRLTESRHAHRQWYTITWRGRCGESSSGMYYDLEDAQRLARECGAADIVVEETPTAADVAPRVPRLLNEAELKRIRTRWRDVE
jgi:hypothetical protein